MNDATYFAIKCMAVTAIACVAMFSVVLIVRPEAKIDPVVALALSTITTLGGFIGGYRLGAKSGQVGVDTQTTTSISEKTESKPTETKTETQAGTGTEPK
jgi:hypothetical protein